MKILLTGDEGHIGTRAKGLLVQAGHEVVGFDLKRGAHEDVRVYESVKKAAAGCEVVIHTAGLPHPWGPPLDKYLDYNFKGTLHILKAAQEAKVRRVIYTSSTAYYGCDIRGKLTPRYFPIDEAHPPASAPGVSEGGLEEYNQSKVMIEELLAYYGRNRLVETVALRIAPANTKADQYPPGFDWRKDRSWRFGCFFSNCHPQYAAQALVAAAQAEGPFHYEVFNVADRYTHRSVDVAEFLAEHHPQAEVRAKMGEHSCLFDTRKAQDVLGFKPCEEME